eukprot:14090834-Alexandrium_andersonii.AAC.1
MASCGRHAGRPVWTDSVHPNPTCRRRRKPAPGACVEAMGGSRGYGRRCGRACGGGGWRSAGAGGGGA